MFGVEQQGQLARAVDRDADFGDVAEFALVGDGGYRRLAASSTRSEMRALSGRIAPRQRRGRNGLIGVSASMFDPSGRMGPCADKL